MFARKVAVLLKPNSLPEFNRLIETEILPWLREQDGFLDLITLVLPNGREVATISFWDHPADAAACPTTRYPEGLDMLAGLMDAKPYVKTFRIVSSTLPRVAPERCLEAVHREEMDARTETSV